MSPNGEILMATRASSPFVEYNLEASEGLSCFSTWNIGFADSAEFTEPLHPSIPGPTAPVTAPLEMPDNVGISAVFETQYFLFDTSRVPDQSVAFTVQPNRDSTRGYVQIRTILIDLYGEPTTVGDTTWTSFTKQDAMRSTSEFSVSGFYKVRFEFFGNSGTRLRFDNVGIYGCTAIPTCPD